MGECFLASWASISERMWKKCEFEVGVRWSNSGRVSSLPSVNFERRLGRPVWRRRRGGEEGPGEGFAIAMLLSFGRATVKCVDTKVGCELCLISKLARNC